MRTNKKLIGIVPDIHVPQHDPKAVSWCFNRLREERPYKIIFIGDLFDFYSISVFLKKPSFTSRFAEEVFQGNKFIERVKHLQKSIKCKVAILAGNHESRLTKYLWKNAPALADLPELTIPSLFKFPDDWEYFSYNLEGIKADGVTVFHGRKYSGNVCIANLRKFYGSVIQGHSHRASAHYLRRPNGELIGAVEAGCLCDLHPDYSAHVDWVQAMAWIDNGLPFLELK